MIIAENIELLEKVSDVVTHPSWQGAINETTAAILLQNQPIMTYLLRQGNEGETDFWLSHKKCSGEIHHRHFTITPFSDGLLFSNLHAPSCENLDGFIEGALACKR